MKKVNEISLMEAQTTLKKHLQYSRIYTVLFV